MNNLINKVQLLSRTEMAIWRINLQTVSRQIILYAVGIVLILLAVGMFNAALYIGLSERYGGVTAALVAAALNGVLAGTLIVVAQRTGPGPEAAMAKEIRSLAIAEINADYEKIQQNLQDVKADVKKIRAGFGGLGVSGGGSVLGLMNLAPLLDLLISSLRKAKSK